MGSNRRSLRVFISSPDDVKDEREAARRVIRRLADEFRHAFDLDEVMWEWQPLLASQHFQTQITPPRDTDITVVIVWSRLGTPLPIERFPGPLSKSVVTGTEWEFEDALASMRERRAPEVLVYRKREASLRLQDSIAALDEQRQQLRMVESFFLRWFATQPDGNVDFAVRAFRSTPEFETLVEEHLRKLLKQRLGPGVSPIRWHAGSPYRGLASFEPDHASIFFGRAAVNGLLRERLERRLADRVPFVVVLGASGSGKSSLVKAGLIPSLEAGSWIGRIGVSRRAIFRPADDESDPLAALARALLSPTALPELGARGFGDTEKLVALLRESPTSAASLIAQALREVAAAQPPRANQRAGLLVVVDQLEELFTLPFSDNVDRGFIDVLESLARASVAAGLPDDAPPIVVVATMRSDFYGHLDRLLNLAQLVQGDGQFLLLAPREVEISQMIRMPAELAGLRFEHDPQRGIGLDDEILSVAQRDTRVLPLLSFVLNQLWQRRAADGVLTFDAYRELGGLEGALAKRAEEVLAGLPAEVHATLADVLGALVHVVAARSGGANPTKTADFTARWLALDRFPAHSPQRRLIEALLDPEVRLLVAEGDRDQVRIRVAHEALLSHWQRARELLEADRITFALIERLEQAELLWRDSSASDRLLPSGLALAEATDLLARRRDRLTKGLVEFVEASALAEHDRQRQRARRTRRLVTVFGSVAFVASVLGVLAWRKSVQAGEQARIANDHREVVQKLVDAVSGGALGNNETGTFGWRRSFLQHMLDSLGSNEPPLESDSRFEHDRQKMLLLTRLAAGELAAGERAKGKAHFETALEIARRLETDAVAELQIQRDISNMFVEIGDAHLQSGNPSAAQPCYEESLGISRRLAEAMPDDTQAQRDLSATLDRVGDAQFQLGDPSAAQERYEESLGISRRLAEAMPDDAQAQRDLSVGLVRVGDMHLQLGNPSAAQRNYEERLKISRRLADAVPNNVQAQRDLSVGLIRVGDSHLQLGHPSAALERHDESLDIRRRLASADPKSAQEQRDLSVTLNHVGDARLQLGDVSTALAHFAESVVIARCMAERDPSSSLALDDLSFTLGRVGAALGAKSLEEKHLSTLRRIEDALARPTTNEAIATKLNDALLSLRRVIERLETHPKAESDQR